MRKTPSRSILLYRQAVALASAWVCGIVKAGAYRASNGGEFGRDG